MLVEFKLLSCLFLLLFLIVASIDGLYFHLYKYKLYARKDSRKEHLLHTLNSILFPWSIYFLFLDEFKGIYLWFGVFLTLISLIIEYMDVFEENKSRKTIGGLTSLEYSMHFGMSALRSIYTTLILVSKPKEDWFITGGNIIQNTSSDLYMKYFLYPVILMGLFVAGLHFVLIFYKKEIKTI